MVPETGIDHLYNLLISQGIVKTTQIRILKRILIIFCQATQPNYASTVRPVRSLLLLPTLLQKIKFNRLHLLTGCYRFATHDSFVMSRKLDDILVELPQQKRDKVEARTMELATRKDLRQTAEKT